MTADLQLVEAIIDASGQAKRIEMLLPVGVRPRQLSVRTLMVGMTLAMLGGREAFLRNVHKALLALPTADQRRLGVIATWKHGPHTLTYRQLEYTYRLIASKLAKDTPDGSPSEALSAVLDQLLEASITVLGEPDSSSYAVDWTDHETWARPPRKCVTASDDRPPDPGATELTMPGEDQPDPAVNQQDEHQEGQEQEECADREAAWGHRNTNHPGRNEMFFGYHLQAVTIVKDESGPEVPELVRRIHLASCEHDPPKALVPTLKRMAASGIELGDVLADSGYSYRVATDWALPLRALGAQLIQDLHPADRGPHGTHHGAIINNGGLYCPATPKPLLELGPLHRGATIEQTHAHDNLTAELHRHKLKPLTAPDPDGYHRVICPAIAGTVRCPRRPTSMTLTHDRPTILTPPDNPPVCCTQKTITVPPHVNAKTAQKHDWPSPQHRRSYNRRTAAERTFANLTDRATNDLSRGWTRLTGLTPIALFIATAFIARNLRVADAFTARQTEDARRAAQGIPPKRRKRRRHTLEDLVAAANAPPQRAAPAA